MRFAGTLIIALCMHGSAGAAPVNCRHAPAGHEVMRYERVHDVTLHRVLLGPDAIQYEREDVVQAIDELIVWRPSAGSACVVLTAYDRNGAECDVAGIATATGDGAHLFSEGGCSLRFVFTPETAALYALTACGAGYCMRGGVIENASYMKK